MAYCGQHSLVKHAPGFKEAITLRCRSWTCPDCQPKRRARLIAQAIGGEPNTFITLTLPSHRAADAEDAVKELSRAWRIIRKRDGRRRKAKPIPFLAVVELTKAGTPHLHIIARCKWMDQAWLSNCMAEIAQAPIVKIQRIDNKGRVAGYCAKYCGKDCAKIGTNKRYWQSRDFNLKPKPEDDHMEEGAFWGAPWEMKLRRVAQEYEARGWEVHWVSLDRIYCVPPDDG